MTQISSSDNLLALTDTIQAINSSLELDEVLCVVMDTIIRLTHAERGFLMLRDEWGELSTVIARDWEQESLNKSELAVSQTVIQRVLASGQPVLTTNAQADPRFGNQNSVISHNLRSILCVPLKVKDTLTGVIYADNRIRAGIFTQKEKDVLTIFANHAAVALENARLFESVHQSLAKVSELKGLMDNVFASIASGVITADLDHRILMCNQAAQSILNLPGQALVGKSLEEIFTPWLQRSEAQEFFKGIQRVCNTESQIVGKEIHLALQDHDPISLRFNLSAFKDAKQTTQGITIVFDDETEIIRLQAQRRLFERMVAPGLIDQLNPDQLQPGGKRVEISILFADLRNFTSFSEQFSPEEVMNTLNHYLGAAVAAILAQQGTIDKFQGDAVMAWFNAPFAQHDHTLRAIRAALGIQEAVLRLHQELPQQNRLHFGIGIHSGEAVLGLVGAEQRLDYTAIGDCINTAKRIQEAATASQILISEDAFQAAPDQIIARLSAPLVAKGKQQPLCVYEVTGCKDILLRC